MVISTLFYQFPPVKLIENDPYEFLIVLKWLKMNRTKKRGHQKIELTFSFMKEIPQKIIRNKKKSTLKFGLKNTPLGR